MQRNECTPGTEVIIRGTIITDECAKERPIRVECKIGGYGPNILFFHPSALEPALPKYDPKREFRKGDKVRFIPRGRRNYVVEPEPGEELTVLETERQEHVLVRCCRYTASLHFADLVLVEPVEEACCNTTEQAPTVEMIEEAYNRLEELVIQCKTPVLMTMIFRKDGKTNQRISTNDSVSGMAGSEGIKWTAARGFLYAAGACISGVPQAVLQGIEYTFEFLERKEKKGLFEGITDTPFEH